MLIATLAGSVQAAEIQLASPVQGSPSASANGDSGSPIISADHRYIVFASSADNLVATNQNGPVPGLRPRYLNVFLRDRLAQTNYLVSASLGGAAGNANSWPSAISTNDQYVLFESSANNLVPGDNNSVGDVYVRDLEHGTNILVSVNTNGVSGNGVSDGASMTPDGRYVVFVSAASDLVAGDTNGIPDVFVRDLQNGTTTLVTGQAKTTFSGSLPSESACPVITPDGRYVTYFSTATNLVPGDTSAGEVFVYDQLQGATTWASTNARALFQASYNTIGSMSCDPAISDDGSWVAFLVAQANSLEAASTAHGMILRYNLATGSTIVVHTNAYIPYWMSLDDLKPLTLSSNGQYLAFTAFNPNNIAADTIVYENDVVAGTNIPVSVDQSTGLPSLQSCDYPVMDPSGRYITFACYPGINLSGVSLGTNTPHLFISDMQLGTTTLIDANTNDVGVGCGPDYNVSADASEVALEAPTGDFVSTDRNQDNDVIIRDLAAGTNELISAAEPSLPAIAPNGWSELFTTSLSADGRFIAFVSDADNLVTNDFNSTCDVFVRDTLLNTNILISVGTNGNSASGLSFEPSISGNGRYVAYSSYATNIIPVGPFRFENVFVRDLEYSTNLLVSFPYSGTYANSNSYSPQISFDGRYILYRSVAGNLVSGVSKAGVENLYLYDQTLNTNYAITTGSVGGAAMTPDGQYIAFVGVTGGSPDTALYVWSSTVGGLVYTNTSVQLTNVAISADGRLVAYSTGSSLDVADLVAQTNYQVAAALIDVRAGLQFSTNDQFLAFATKTALVSSDTNGNYDVYLHDFSLGTNVLVSHAFNSSYSANGPSYWQSLSPDGRLVMYRSFATNIIPNDTNKFANIYLYDRLSGMTALVTANQAGNSVGNYFSQSPLFSANGQTAVFASFASDLPGGVQNEYNAIYQFDLPAASGGSSTNANSTAFGATIQFTNLVINGISTSASIVSWPTPLGAFYQVQYKNNLTDPTWQNLESTSVEMGNSVQAYDLAPASNQRFYRLVLVNGAGDNP